MTTTQTQYDTLVEHMIDEEITQQDIELLELLDIEAFIL